MEQETQQQPQDNSQKKLLWKSPSGLRHYSPPDRNRWPPYRKQILGILTTIVAVTAFITLSTIVYFYGWQLFVQAPGWAVGVVVALVAAVLSLIALSYRQIWDWLGFGEQGEKTGLDLIQVVAALSIPIVVAVAGYLFAESQNRSRLNAEEQRAQDEALQAYQDGMETLILEQDLRNSEEDDEVRTLARARTLTVLARVDAVRQREVVRFLYEAQLIGYFRPALERSNTPAIDIAAIVRLAGADLSGTDLSGELLRGADLGRADLSGADLSDTELRDAELSDANLSDATVTQEQLAAASSLEGAVMPDGTRPVSGNPVTHPL